MDISVLLALQDFREGVGGVWTDFMLKMTFWGELNTVLVIMALVYWCASKDIGSYLLMGWNGNRLVNGFLKITACAYRPWIRDARVIPHAASMASATGYSFPSGHATNAGSAYGGIAVRKDMSRALRVALGLLVALVALSRCFIGVHTPQDVLVGAPLSMFMMWLVCKLSDWLKARPEKVMTVVYIGLALSAALALYAALKPYPVDYDSEGKLLVDGAKMASDTFKGVGWCLGFLIGWPLEMRFVRFTTAVSAQRKAARLVAGLLLFYVVLLVLTPLLVGWIPGPAGVTLSRFMQMFYIVFLFPWIFQRLEKER